MYKIISFILDDLENAVMVMLNAIYFNGYWKRPFPLNETIESAFFVTPTQQVRTPFMCQTSDFFFLESQQMDAKILRLPYKGKKYAMIIVLPNAKGGLNELINQLDSTTLQRSKYLMDEHEVRVQLPKFKFDYTAELNDFLENVSNFKNTPFIVKKKYLQITSIFSLELRTYFQMKLHYQILHVVKLLKDVFGYQKFYKKLVYMQMNVEVQYMRQPKLSCLINLVVILPKNLLQIGHLYFLLKTNPLEHFCLQAK